MSSPRASNKPLENSASTQNENIINEIKLLKKENESLTREVAQLREEGLRMKKTAILSNTGIKSAGNSADFSDLLNNRVLILVIALVAIIMYLLLFR